MTDETKLTMGTEASCSDGKCGEVLRVVVNPRARTVTHLVVEPDHHRRIDRLVPLDLVDVVPGGVRLRCTRAEFDELDPAEETEFVPENDGHSSYLSTAVVSWPYYGLGPAGMRGVGMAGPALINDPGPHSVTYDTVPAGEVAVRRGEPVHATDGDIGHIQGVVIDPDGRKVTSLVLQEGHMWGRKRVTIPIDSVDRVGAGIWLKLTKKQVEDLPEEPDR